MSERLQVFEGLPAELCACGAERLAELLGGPALVHVAGAREPPLLVSVLLHGNETSGWDALRRLLQQSGPLPRSLLIFIGNVAAAAAGVRTLPDQADFNRIWGGPSRPAERLAADLLTALDRRRCFAAVDLHNNTGHNPHYSVLAELTGDNLGLASLFDDKVVYVQQPDTVLIRAFAGRWPALTLELGPIGDPRCAERGFDYLQRCLCLEALPGAERVPLQLFRAEARVHVHDHVAFCFAGGKETAPLVLTGGMEAVNFHELPAGTEFALHRDAPAPALKVLDTGHRDVTGSFLTLRDHRLLLARPVIPAMYTTDQAVVRQDCLCYFMARMPLPAALSPDTSGSHPPHR